MNLDVTKNLTSWVSPKLELSGSDIEGYGLLSREPIDKGEVLSVFGGKVYTETELLNMPKNSYIVNTATQLNESFFLGPLGEKTREWGFYINHSCEPNTKITDSVFLVTIKEVAEGEEITFDYAHSHNKFLNFECTCGCPSCRKFVSNDDFLNEAYAEKNLKHYTSWLKKLYMSKKSI